MAVIDFHCHLDLYPYPALAVEDAAEAGVYVLFVTTTPKAWPKATVMVEGHRRIRVGLGLHPEVAHEREKELPLFEKFGTQTKYFGEIGLDGSPRYKKYQEVQIRAFGTALEVASKLGGRILSIHSRRAAQKVLDVLAQYPDSGIPVLHWFSGSKRELAQAIDQDCWFSCGPAMLGSEKGRVIAREIPRERMLTETDGPFASVGSRPLQPADSWMAVRELSKIWGVGGEEVGRRLRRNLGDLTGRVKLK